MYGVYSGAITKGRNNPDPNIEDLICVRSNQWCIRTQDSIKCKKLATCKIYRKKNLNGSTCDIFLCSNGRKE